MSKARTLPPDPYSLALWVPCDACENYWCHTHGQHVHDCLCPPIEEWPPPELWAKEEA